MTIVVKTWNYSGSVKTWTVPANVVQARFECWGAVGGACFTYGATLNATDAGSVGGVTGVYYSNPGGYIAGTKTVAAGEVYNLFVGGNGYTGQHSNSSTTGSLRGGKGGWNGGGAGGTGWDPVSGAHALQPGGGGGGGGGGTDVRQGGVDVSNRIIAAGGAGGVGGAHPTGKGTQKVVTTANPTAPDPPYGFPLDNGKPSLYISAGGGRGGAGGGDTGGPGQGSGGGFFTSAAGKGATSTAGGAKGTSLNGSAAGTVGTTGYGGVGGSCNSTDANTSGITCGGGGGGGGYRGGGGGASAFGGDFNNPGTGGGGGGGSNFISGAFSSTYSKARVYTPWKAGATGAGGFLRVTYTQPPDAPTIDLPLDRQSFAANQELDVEFQFTSPDPAAICTGYDIQWRLGAGSFTLTHIGPIPDAAEFTYTYPANFFTAGNTYDIQVRTYDQNNDVSAWASRTVTAVNLPTAPTITAPTPGQVFTTTSIPVTWTNGAGSPELLFEVSFLDKSGAKVFDSGPKNTNTRVNLCPNPSFEVDTSTWVISGGTLALSTTFKVIGADSGKITWNTVTTSTAQVYIPVATQPGLPYTVSAKVTAGASTDHSITLAAQNPTDTSPFVTGDTVGDIDTSPWVAGTFQTPTLTFIAQAATTWIVFIPADGNTTTGKVNYIDTVLVEVDSEATPRTYFDGSNLNGNTGTVSWKGTTGKSESVLTNSDVLSYTFTWPGSAAENNQVFVSIATVASNGIFSDSTSKTFTVNVQPPRASTVTVTPQDDDGSVKIHMVTGAIFFQTFWWTAYWDIYRTDPTTGIETRIATKVVPSNAGRTDAGGDFADFYDRTAATERTYTYRVRAYSDSGGFSDMT